MQMASQALGRGKGNKHMAKALSTLPSITAALGNFMDCNHLDLTIIHEFQPPFPKHIRK